MQALYNLIQIKFLVIQGQINVANETGDTSQIDSDLLIDTRDSLQVLVHRMTVVFGEQQEDPRPEYTQAS